MSETIKVGDRVTIGDEPRQWRVIWIDEGQAWLKTNDLIRTVAYVRDCRPVPKPFADVRTVGSATELFIDGQMVATNQNSVGAAHIRREAERINAAHVEVVKAAVESALGEKS